MFDLQFQLCPGFQAYIAAHRPRLAVKKKQQQQKKGAFLQDLFYLKIFTKSCEAMNVCAG